MALTFKVTDEKPEWASEVQWNAVKAVKAHGSGRAAERALGMGNDSISKPVRRFEKLAALHGHAPGHFDDGVAPGYRMGKVTIQRGPAGVDVGPELPGHFDGFLGLLLELLGAHICIHGQGHDALLDCAHALLHRLPLSHGVGLQGRGFLQLSLRCLVERPPDGLEPLVDGARALRQLLARALHTGAALLE